MQKYCSLWHLKIQDYTPHTNAMNYGASSLLITVFCLWSHWACLFVFCSHSAVFSMSQHVSMSAALPTGVWFMNPILVCHYWLQKGALMLNLSPGESPHVTNVMSILLTTCGQQHLRFRWYKTRWYIKMLHEILGYLIFLPDHFSCFTEVTVNFLWLSDPSMLCSD